MCLARSSDGDGEPDPELVPEPGGVETVAAPGGRWTDEAPEVGGGVADDADEAADEAAAAAWRNAADGICGGHWDCQRPARFI